MNKKSPSPSRLPAATPPPAPSRWPTIPQVKPTDPAYLLYSMLASYKAGTTPDVRAATASLIAGQLHKKPELQVNKETQRTIKAAIAAIVEDLSRFNTGFGLVAYTLSVLQG